LAPPAGNLQKLDIGDSIVDARNFAHISHDRAKKGTAMFTVLLIAAAYGGWRLVHAALESLRELPRTNDDMIFY